MQNYVLFINRRVCVARRMDKIRVASIQWKLQAWSDTDAFFEEIAYQVRTAREDYRADLCVFPEYVAAGFPGGWPEITQWENFLSALATEQQLWIVGGSIPHERDGGIYNVCCIVGPNGKIHRQEKLHITPWEKNAWNMQGGSDFSVIDIGKCTIAVAICYDVEFPEQIRALADAGCELLCVPYCTDDNHGHHRVTRCALARAIENTMFVVSSGCVGSLRRCPGFAHHYARSVIATPCDIGFPAEGIAAQAEPQQSQCLVAELDMNLLRKNRDHGTVSPRKDLRRELFSGLG